MERSMPADPQALFDKIQALPPERIAGVEDFVDFIASRAENKQLGRSAMAASAASFAAIWENPEDDAYDAL
jgi:hypothetical protein